MPRITLGEVNQPVQNTSEAANSSLAVEPAPKVLTTDSGPPDAVDATSTDGELRRKTRGPQFISDFFAFPTNLTFYGEEQGENIILLLRAHIITNVRWVAVTVIFLVLPLVLFPVAATVNFVPGIGLASGILAALLWYSLVFTYAFLNFLYWYFNVYILTDERLVDVDWYSVVYRKVSTTEIAKIQDTSAVQVGALTGIFDYGDVLVQTAATEEENFQMTAVPHPQLVVRKVDELTSKEELEMEGKSQ